MGTKKTVVVIESDFRMLNMLKGLIERRGHKAIGASTPADALSVISNNPKADMVMIYIGLHEDDCGFTTAKHARNVSPNSTIVLITAGSEAKNLFETQKDIGAKILEKPFNFERLFEVTGL